jgi:hypothetical protein
MEGPMKATKCDRCGDEIPQGFYVRPISLHPLGQVPNSKVDYKVQMDILNDNRPIDLCLKCVQSLEYWWDHVPPEPLMSPPPERIDFTDDLNEKWHGDQPGGITLEVKPVPVYCTKCGARCRDQWKFIGYDHTDGKMMYHVKSVCSNRRHIFDGHTSEWRWYGEEKAIYKV